ncbi:CoA ester lyase [Paraburkholderia sp. 22B1P]|uniref:HpcH/HpaI aldolase/citrate lyase family protein n=1 Tax=Paraburkholderia sp. 22B1P TaxID=3080498 RepID=UPI003089A9D4|nr:CoA ester lyase [Paraburkholderia sp. 22B1P]
MNAKIARSFLFVPGSRSERFQKAVDAGADAVIVDLEDAVAPHDKGFARDRLAGWASSNQPVYVRINGTTTEWFEEDLRLCELEGIAGIVIPKVEKPDQVSIVASCLQKSKVIFPIIESALGFANIRSIASVPSVTRLMFGSLDLQADLSLGGQGEELHYFMSQIVVESKIADLPSPVDSVTANLQDARVLTSDAARARRFGFRGKLCIHPNQISIVNSAFNYSAKEAEWAARVIQADAESAGAAVAVDGRMVDAPVIARAREILEFSARVGAC